MKNTKYPENIDRMLKKIKKKWKEQPSLRLIQLIINRLDLYGYLTWKAIDSKDGKAYILYIPDLYHIGDDIVEEAFTVE